MTASIRTRVEPTCPYCAKPAELIDSIEKYKVRSYGMMWICWPCDAYVGTHKNSRNHAPLGRLANAELRKWKQAAHAAFDPLWQSGGMKRTEAYALMRELLGIPKEEAHIGMFDVERCKLLIEKLNKREAV